MPIHNADIAAVFGEIADRLEIEDANPFRVRAYRNAARRVGELGRSVRTMIEQGARAEAMAAAAREVLRIKAFGVNQYGESLFCPNSEKWRTKNPA